MYANERAGVKGDRRSLVVSRGSEPSFAKPQAGSSPLPMFRPSPKMFPFPIRGSAMKSSGHKMNRKRARIKAKRKRHLSKVKKDLKLK
jgi:hypothetical protein